MALNQPTNVYPSTLAGTGLGTIDINDGLSVSWNVTGNNLMEGYMINIYPNNSDDGAYIYSTDKVVLSEPFSGVDYKGEQQRFYADTIDAADLISAGMVNGHDSVHDCDNYKFVIYQYTDTDTDTYIKQSSASVFNTRTTPTLVLGAIADPLESRGHSFTATYTQAQDDLLNHVRWTLFDSNDNVLSDTGNIYGTSELRFDYDGFFSGQSYRIVCTIETENGIEVTAAQTFDVVYDSQVLDGYISTCIPKGESCIQIAFPQILYIPGIESAGIMVNDGLCILPTDNAINWNSVNGSPMSLQSPWTLVWCGKIILNSGASTASFLQVGSLVFQLDDTTDSLKIYQNGYLAHTLFAGHFEPDAWLTLIITKDKSYLQVYKGGLLPGELTLPAEDLYPQDFQSKEIYTAVEEISMSSIAAVKLMADSNTKYLVCKYVGILKGTMSEDVAYDKIEKEFEEPSFDSDTQMLARFAGGTWAGTVEANDATGLALYRREESGATIRHLYSCAIGDISEIRDYGAKSQTNYEYLCYTIRQDEDIDTYSQSAFTSGKVSYKFWDWTLLECEKIGTRTYSVLNQYRFGLNLSTGALSNNNNPTVSQNFTRYPTRQVSSSNYKTGSLTSYIGRVDMQKNVYRDSIPIAEQLFNLSTNTNPKFLKDRKGNLWKVETQAPISVDIGDNYAEQPYEMTVDWMETGDASDVVIISTPDDTYWTDYGDSSGSRSPFAYTGTAVDENGVVLRRYSISYEDLSDKPTLNGVEIVGDMVNSDLKLVTEGDRARWDESVSVEVDGEDLIFHKAGDEIV